MELPEKYQDFYESFPTHAQARQMTVAAVVKARQERKQVVFVDAQTR